MSEALACGCARDGSRFCTMHKRDSTETERSPVTPPESPPAVESETAPDRVEAETLNPSQDPA